MKVGISRIDRRLPRISGRLVGIGGRLLIKLFDRFYNALPSMPSMPGFKQQRNWVFAVVVAVAVVFFLFFLFLTPYFQQLVGWLRCGRFTIPCNIVNSLSVCYIEDVVTLPLPAGS